VRLVNLVVHPPNSVSSHPASLHKSWTSHFCTVTSHMFTVTSHFCTVTSHMFTVTSHLCTVTVDLTQGVLTYASTHPASLHTSWIVDLAHGLLLTSVLGCCHGSSHIGRGMRLARWRDGWRWSTLTTTSKFKRRSMRSNVIGRCAEVCACMCACNLGFLFAHTSETSQHVGE
jgi:hypothetical protein